MKRLIVFTDLDGTLLDHATYAWDAARPALQRLRDGNIPLILCSSKTRREIEHYRRALGNQEPFISENGGGIFIPAGYFKQVSLPSELDVIRKDGYELIRLGAPYTLLRQTLQELREEGFALTGFGDMTAREVATLTALPLDQAAMAKDRDFDEPFVFHGGPAEVAELVARVREKGLCTTKGQHLHLLGHSDKGVAVKILASLFRASRGEVSVIALGDSPNDLPMLQQADYPVAVKRPDGRHERSFGLPHLIRTDGIGPAGWNAAVLALLDRGA